MNTCNSFHESIAFDAKQCPLCKEREERVEVLDKIVEKITEFRGSFPVN